MKENEVDNYIDVWRERERERERENRARLPPAGSHNKSQPLKQVTNRQRQLLST